MPVWIGATDLLELAPFAKTIAPAPAARLVIDQGELAWAAYDTAGKRIRQGGYAIHGSHEVPGYHASHGCVRIFVEDAAWLYREFVTVGETQVWIDQPVSLLGDRQSCTIIREVAEVTRTWQAVAAEVGAKRAEITREASAFEHEDLQAALKLQVEVAFGFFEGFSEYGIFVMSIKRVNIRESGYMLEVPLLLMVVGVISAIILPQLALAWKKVYLVIVSIPVLLLLYYIIVTPGWNPSGRINAPWNTVTFALVAIVIVGGVFWVIVML